MGTTPAAPDAPSGLAKAGRILLLVAAILAAIGGVLVILLAIGLTTFARAMGGTGPSGVPFVGALYGGFGVLLLVGAGFAFAAASLLPPVQVLAWSGRSCAWPVPSTRPSGEPRRPSWAAGLSANPFRLAPAVPAGMPHITSRFVDCHVFRRAPDGRDEWLMLRRAPGFMGDTWQMVSGTIEGAEKAYQCAQRELFEETGLRPLHFYQASYVNRFYLAATDEIVLSPVFAAEVAPDAQVRLSEEHVAFQWVDWQEAMRRMPWPGQRKALAVIREQFIDAKPFDPSCIDGYLDD